MNSPAHLLSLISAVAHLIIGMADLFRIGTRFLPPSWVVIYNAVPYGEWLYPGAFVATGIVAMIGVAYPTALRLGFLMSGTIFFLWGLAGFYSYSRATGGNIQGSVANIYLACTVIIIAYFVAKGVQSDSIDKGVKKLQEKVDEANGH